MIRSGVDAARVGDHEDRLLCRTVKDQADVTLGRNLRCWHHQNLVDDQPLDRHPKNLRRMLGCLGRIACQLDPACLAAPTGMDLCLHHHGATDTTGNCLGFRRRDRNVAVGQWDACGLEQVARLIFMQIHEHLSEVINRAAN